MESQAWRTALDPAGEWIPAVLAAADQRLSEVRRQVPDAGALVRLAVGVYATSTSTPLFFAQAVGRFVRSRARGETASVFLPSVTPLLGLAGEMEVARDHVLAKPGAGADEDALFSPEDRLLAQANKEEAASAELLPGFEAMGSQAEFDRVLFDGGEFGTGAMVGSVEEQEYLGLPGLLEPEQVTALLRQRQDNQIDRGGGGNPRRGGETCESGPPAGLPRPGPVPGGSAPRGLHAVEVQVARGQGGIALAQAPGVVGQLGA